MAKDQSPEIRDVNGYKHGRVPREVRRTQLLELAEELFMEKGYGGATGLVGPLAEQLADLRDTTVQQIAMVATQFAPRAEREQITLWAHAVSGAGEQLGRWWLRNPDVPRERVIAFYADFLDAA